MEASSRKKTAAAAPNTCKFFQLPYPLIFDILSRLPANDLLHYRCVCKRFLCFISRSPLCILSRIRPLRTVSERLHLSHVDADANADADGVNFQVSILNFTPTFNLPASEFSDMSACNGLICFVGAKTDDSFYVCNPILGEFITVQPPYGRNDMYRGKYWGLGYSSLTNQYKILQSYYDVNGSDDERRDEIFDALDFDEMARANERVEIYTTGTGTWRSIENAPKDLVSLPFNAFLNGVIHWSPISPRGGEFINSFDFDAEQFGIVPPPDHFQELGKEYSDYTITGVLGGCLFIIYFADSTQFDIWVMKEYGVKESWTKQFVIENLYPRGQDYNFYEPMVVLSNGEILMLLEGKAIVCYNQKTKQHRDFFQTRSWSESFDAIAYNPCFVSLHNVAKGEQISRIQSNGVYDNICKEEFLGCIG